jgi:hypothetical protein
MTYPAATIALLDGVRGSGRARLRRERSLTTSGQRADASGGVDRAQRRTRADGAPARGARRHDAQNRSSELPSGDEIAAEVEQFLREQDD